MIIPDHWAEARLKRRLGQRSITVRRFGWSNLTPTDAQANAEARAGEALERIANGEKLDRRERKVAYNGAEGVPIREEVISRLGEAVVTRNLYGALCLNTPDVLFADIDFPPRRPWKLMFALITLLAGGAALLAWPFRSPLGLILGLLTAAYLGGVLARAIHRRLPDGLKNAEATTRTQLTKFLTAHPDWRLALYRTPAGIRALALHRLFQPDEPAVAAFFDAIGADPTYVRMCRHQKCFRARVSPKPWRIGIKHHLGPRPGVWPINPARLPERVRWVTAYEAAAQGFAACRPLEELGAGTRHPQAQALQQLHDRLCRADSGLPIA
jgi:hypothetical protein